MFHTYKLSAITPLIISIYFHKSENDDYGLMNYVLAGVCLMVLGPSIAIYKKYKSAETNIQPEEILEILEIVENEIEERCDL